MSVDGDPVLQAAVDAAVSAVQAGRGWILAPAPRQEAQLEVVASSSTAATGLGTVVPVDGSVGGYVASLGQPLAAVLRSPDQFPNDVSSAGGGDGPESVLCVPCEHDDVLTGVLQVVDAVGGSFSFDDVELVTVLSGVVGAALAARATGAGRATVPLPSELGSSLGRLADSDPASYRTLASLLGALLADG